MADEKPKLLLVEDHTDTLMALKTLLKRKYDVVTAMNGKEALERIAERRPDIVVTDYDMPEMDGRSLAETMRADAAMKDIPVIVVTGQHGKGQAMVDEGLAQAVLGKPISDFSKFLELIQQTLPVAAPSVVQEHQSLAPAKLPPLDINAAFSMRIPNAGEGGDQHPGKGHADRVDERRQESQFRSKAC